MNEGLIPRRYAKALYLVAQEKNTDSRIYDMMKCLVKSFDAQPAFQEILANPYVAVADKCQLLSTAAGAEKADTVYADYLKLLTENRRLDMARDIAYAYIKLYRESNRIYEVKIMSAAPLSADEQLRLREMISRHLNGGIMEYTENVDPDLIGGFTVSVGNERIDASISNELKQLRLNLITK